MDMLQSARPTNSSPDIPIAYTGCFGDYNVTSCVRDSVLSSFAIITAIVCAVKLYQLYHNHHSLVNQYVIFLCAFVESILCAINWVYLWKNAVIYALEFLKIVQFVIVCRFYCSLAAQIYRKDMLARRIIPLAAVVFLVAVFAICVSGWSTLESEALECRATQWIMLSLAEFVNAQLFLISGIFVTKKLNDVRTLDDMRNSKKRELWGSITVFEVTAIASVTHDIIFKALGDNGCQGILSTSASGYTAVYIAFKITRWLLPIWAMAALFAVEDNIITHESLASLVVTAPAGFRSTFRTHDRGLDHHHHSDQPASNPAQPKRLLLPPFLRSAGQYGTINEAGSYQTTGHFDEVPPPQNTIFTTKLHSSLSPRKRKHFDARDYKMQDRIRGMSNAVSRVNHIGEVPTWPLGKAKCMVQHMRIEFEDILTSFAMGLWKRQ